MIERILIFLGAVFFTVMGIQEEILLLRSPDGKPVKESLEHAMNVKSRNRWITVGEHYVDWNRAYVQFENSGNGGSPEISLVAYALQQSEEAHDWGTERNIIIVYSHKYKHTYDLPEGIRKYESLSGIIDGRVGGIYAPEKELKASYPGLEPEKTVLLREGRYPDRFRAGFMTAAGILCIILTIYFSWYSYSTGKKHSRENSEKFPETVDGSSEQFKPKKFYRLSGKFSLSGLIVSLIASFVLIMAVMALYVTVIRYSRWMTVSIICLMVFSIICSTIITAFAQKGGVRSYAVTFMFSAAGGIYTIVSRWFISGLILTCSSGSGINEIAKNIPEMIGKGMFSPEIAGISGTEASVLFWLEPAVFIFLAVFIPWAVMITSAYCEFCGKWTEGRKSVSNLTPVNSRQEFMKLTQREQHEFIERIEKTCINRNRLSEIMFEYCTSCGRFYLLTLTDIAFKIGNNNSQTAVKTVLLDRLPVSRQTFEKIMLLKDTET